MAMNKLIKITSAFILTACLACNQGSDNSAQVNASKDSLQ